MDRRSFVKLAGTTIAASAFHRVNATPKGAPFNRITELLPTPPKAKLPSVLSPGWGFSLSHSGLKNEEVMSRLGYLSQEQFHDGEREALRVNLEDPTSGLYVVVEYVLYPEHAALVYGAQIRNQGRRNIEHLTSLLSYDLLFQPLQAVGDPSLQTCAGGGAFEIFPPPAWQLKNVRQFGPGTITLESGSTGRSSNDQLPFFILEAGDGESGLFGAIEWSAFWQLMFARRDEPQPIHYGRLGPNKSLSVLGGMTHVDLTLKTGESFHMPRVLLGFYDGILDHGRNALRRFLNDWAPSYPAGVPRPHVQATPGGYLIDTEPTNDAECRAHAAANAEIGVEYYCIENWFQSLAGRPETRAGGATGACRGSWFADRERFPDLKGFSDYVRSKGMRFGLWTDMEVAHSESIVAREHPDWILYVPGSASGLLNLAIPAAQDWAIETYDRIVKDYGVEYIFYDNNINPTRYWEVNEAPSARGRLQHDHVRGWWRVWEETRLRHPNLVLENCSSGGRRIDLGTFKRAHFHVLSDQFRYPDAIRYQFSGANFFLPGDRMKSLICFGQRVSSDYIFHSNFGGLMSITEDVHHWTSEERAKAKSHIAAYKAVRHLLGKDFFPLFPQPMALEAWDGWEFHDSDTNEGFALVFRSRSPQEDVRIRLRGPRLGEKYSVEDPYSGRREIFDGKRLLEEGISLKLPLNGTRLWTYRPV
jgi:alpha-galactosidase